MNESAFPTTNEQSAGEGCEPGMTLRDYFAAKAMQAYTGDESWRIDMDMRQTATAAYAMADAMLKARKQ